MVPSASASPAPRAGRRRWWLPAVAIAVVVLAVVAGLFATGVVRFGGSSSPAPAYEIFSQAQSTAQAGAGSVAGGPWYAAFGAAVSLPDAVLEPTTNLSSLLSVTNCTPVWPGGEPANLAIPATGPSASVGAAAFWTFGLKNATNALLVETVSDGVASAVFELSGSACSGTIGYLSTFPAGVVDSPAIVSTANAAGGAAFLAAHPNSTRLWGAIGGITVGIFGISPEWFVEYTTCSVPTSSGATGAVFNATLGGTSGAVIKSSTGTTNCVVTAPTGLSLALHPASSPVAVRKAI